MAEDAGGRNSRAHSSHLRMLPGIAVDLCVGELDRLPHSKSKPGSRGVAIVGPRGGHMSVDDIGRHGTGQLPGSRAAHSIGYHEQGAPGADLMIADFRLEAGVAGAQVSNEEGVLVV